MRALPSILYHGLFLAAAIAVSSCAKEPKANYAPPIPLDYKDRHPIIIAPLEQKIEIFLGLKPQIDARQKQELRAFAADYLHHGQGNMVLLVPVGPHGEENPGAFVLRSFLNKLGVRTIFQSNYVVDGLFNEHPIHLAYRKLKASVATKCGQWPEDIVGFQNTRSWNNESYYNFGCAYQNMLANQVADPLDLVRGRPEDHVDTPRRIKVIGTQRDGRDPSTIYNATGTSINRALGSN